MISYRSAMDLLKLELSHKSFQSVSFVTRRVHHTNRQTNKQALAQNKLICYSIIHDVLCIYIYN